MRKSNNIATLLAGIRARMLLFFGGVFVATLVLILLAESFGIPFTRFAGVYQEKQQEAFLQLNTLAEIKKETLLQWIKERRGNARVVSGSTLVGAHLGEMMPQWREYLRSGRPLSELHDRWKTQNGYRGIRNRILSLKNAHDDFESIEIVDADSGLIMVSTEDFAWGSRLPPNEIFRKATTAGYTEVIDVAVHPKSHTLQYIFVHQVPVETENQSDGRGHFALAVFRIDAERAVIPLLNQGVQALGVTGEVVLVNQDLKLLAPVRHRLADGGAPQLFDYRVDTEATRQAARGGEGVMTSIDYRGVPMVAAYRHLRVSSEFAWGLVVKRDQAEVFAPLRESLVRTGLVGILGLAVAFALVFVAAARLSRPVEKLADAARRIEQGDLAARAAIVAPGEIGQLSHTFDSMAERIQGWHRELSAEVERRTHQLERANRLYATLSETNKAIARIKERDPLFQAACRIGVETGRLKAVWVALMDPLDGRLKLVAAHGLPDAFRELVGGSLCELCIKSPSALSINDCAESHPDLWRELGCASMACRRLYQGEHPVGVFALCSEEANFFDEMELSLVNEMATDLSLAIDAFDRDRMLIQQSRLAAMGEMIGNIAHQWRQPINALNLLLVNIRDEYEFGEMNKESLEQNIEEGKRLIGKMSSTIDDFRNFFKPNREKVNFSVSSVVNEVMALLESSLRNNHIEISCEGDEALSVYGYPNEFSQVALNLLGNAKDAIVEHKAAHGRITVRIAEEEGAVVMRVRDNGGGIPEAIQNRLFQPYFTTKEKGTGIGLYMSKMIIESHMGGSIQMRNIEGGAEFAVYCPPVPQAQA
jgi:signal transduction histidine kinase